MAVFKITDSDGTDFGLFNGDTDKDALQALAAAHGYFDWAEACDSGDFDDSTVTVTRV